MNDISIQPLPMQPTSHGANRSSHIKVPPGISILKKAGAEFVGTFILIFCAAATPIINEKFDGAATLIGNAASAGIAVMAVILSMGHISGAHINPSVTIALATFRYFPWIQVPAYVVAQVLGSICASFALKGIYYPFHSGGVTMPSTSLRQAFFLEFVATFILSLVITGVATDARAAKQFSGVAVGFIVMADILIAGPMTGGSMNPVRTLGPAVATGNYKSIWIYFVAPIAGAIFGTAVYTFLKLDEDDGAANDN